MRIKRIRPLSQSPAQVGLLQPPRGGQAVVPSMQVALCVGFWTPSESFGFRGVSGGAGTARVAVLHHQVVKQAATPSMQSRQCRCGPVSVNQPHRSAVPNNLTMPEAMVANEAARIGRRDRTSSSFFKESRQQKLTLLSARGRVFEAMCQDNCRQLHVAFRAKWRAHLVQHFSPRLWKC